MQQSRKLKVRACELTSRIHNHHDRCGFIQRHSGLAKNFRGNEILFFRDNTAGVNHAEISPAPVRFSVKTVARDTRFVADDSPPGAYEAVE